MHCSEEKVCSFLFRQDLRKQDGRKTVAYMSLKRMVRASDTIPMTRAGNPILKVMRVALFDVFQ